MRDPIHLYDHNRRLGIPDWETAAELREMSQNRLDMFLRGVERRNGRPLTDAQRAVYVKGWDR